MQLGILQIKIHKLQVYLFNKNSLKMKIYPIEAGNFKLDGGAMFGVVPKTIWQKTNPLTKTTSSILLHVAC